MIMRGVDKVNLKKWRIIAILFCLVVGTLLHFTYRWSSQNVLIGGFSAVNESTWEHLKLAFFPMFSVAMVGYFLFGERINNYWKANAVGIMVAISFITVFFYTYTGIIGNNYLIIDIGTFMIAVILGENITYNIMKKNKISAETSYVGIIGILLICFILFTYYPPQINYFKDPITNTYGIKI